MGKQRVQINNKFYSFKEVIAGVPQDDESFVMAGVPQGDEPLVMPGVPQGDEPLVMAGVSQCDGPFAFNLFINYFFVFLHFST